MKRVGAHLTVDTVSSLSPGNQGQIGSNIGCKVSNQKVQKHYMESHSIACGGAEPYTIFVAFSRILTTLCCR